MVMESATMAESTTRTEPSIPMEEKTGPEYINAMTRMNSNVPTRNFAIKALRTDASGKSMDVRKSSTYLSVGISWKSEIV
jgi:hypothetical protein